MDEVLKMRKMAVESRTMQKVAVGGTGRKISFALAVKECAISPFLHGQKWSGRTR